MEPSEALKIVRTYVKNENLVNHMLSVATTMRFYAEKFGEDPEKWEVVGLLHDFDWEIHPTLEEHPQAGVPILREHGVPEDIIRAILSHAEETGIARESLMEKALFALVRPSRSLMDLEAKSVKKKWKDRAFAAGANREEIEQGAREFGMDLWEHVDNVIIAMRRIAPLLGLDGKSQTLE